MNKKQKQRLTDAEDQLASFGSIHEIHVSGGLAPGVATIASFAGYHLAGAPGESFDIFCARVRAAARSVKAKLIVFGGLPPPPLEFAEPPGQAEALDAIARQGRDEIDDAE
jgi:hypothetical protein